MSQHGSRSSETSWTCQKDPLNWMWNKQPARTKPRAKAHEEISHDISSGISVSDVSFWMIKSTGFFYCFPEFWNNLSQKVRTKKTRLRVYSHAISSVRQWLRTAVL